MGNPVAGIPAGGSPVEGSPAVDSPAVGTGRDSAGTSSAVAVGIYERRFKLLANRGSALVDSIRLDSAGARLQ